MVVAVYDRRDILKFASAFGTLIVTGMGATVAEDAKGRATGLSLMIEIHRDNSIKIFYPNPEMGQGSSTSVPMIFAEELDADFSLVSVEAMPLMLANNTDGSIRWRVVPQGAGGSTSITGAWARVRTIAATTRQLLLQAAADKWGVNTGGLRTSNGFVIDPARGQKISYGELAEAAGKISLLDGFKPSLKARADYKILGKSHAQKDIRKIVTGAPLFGIDANYPGAKIAVVARSPYLDGEVTNVNDAAARAVSGVIDIVRMPRPALDKSYTYLAAGVAVIAESFYAAKKARDLLDIEWNKGAYTSETTVDFDVACDTALNGLGQIVRTDGDVAAAKASGHVISRRYRQPYVSHAQLEPQNCIAHVRDDAVTIIGPMQSPSGASRVANALTGIDRMNIEVHFTRLGGGFGRRLTSDHAAEAIYISKVCGLPIKVMWTREDDLSHDFFRPAGHHEIVAAFDDNKKLISWEHRLASASKYYRRNNVSKDKYWQPELYPDDFPAGLVPNYQMEYFSMASGMPRGSWRAPAHTANAFVIQSFLDEVAEEFDEDPLELRLRLLGEDAELKYGGHGGPIFDTGRLKGVLRAAAKAADWGKAMPQGYAQGIAGHFTFGGYSAHVAEVELLPDEEFRVHKVYVAVDVGLVINPDGVISQCEGSVNDGLSTALAQEITVENGVVPARNFDSYPLMRMVAAPTEIETIIIESDKDPSGMGEIAIPPIAPAVMNALKRAGGKRVRKLPYSYHRSI